MQISAARAIAIHAALFEEITRTLRDEEVPDAKALKDALDGNDVSLVTIVQGGEDAFRTVITNAAHDALKKVLTDDELDALQGDNVGDDELPESLRRLLGLPA